QVGGIDNTRAYLVSVLLSKEAAKQKNALLAFYRTGHSIHSLKLAIQTLSEFHQGNSQLHSALYRDAVNFLMQNKNILTHEDSVHLNSFFTEGLSSEDLSIVESSKKGLEILE